MDTAVERRDGTSTLYGLACCCSASGVRRWRSTCCLRLRSSGRSFVLPETIQSNVTLNGQELKQPPRESLPPFRSPPMAFVHHQNRLSHEVKCADFALITTVAIAHPGSPVMSYYEGRTDSIFTIAFKQISLVNRLLPDANPLSSLYLPTYNTL